MATLLFSDQTRQVYLCFKSQAIIPKSQAITLKSQAITLKSQAIRPMSQSAYKDPDLDISSTSMRLRSPNSTFYQFGSGIPIQGSLLNTSPEYQMLRN